MKKSEVKKIKETIAFLGESVMLEELSAEDVLVLEAKRDCLEWLLWELGYDT